MTDKAKLLLENLNTNILVTGKTGAGKSTYLQALKIPDSKYFDFVELTQEKRQKRHMKWEEPCCLTDSNFNDFDLYNVKESTLILDAVAFSNDGFNSPLIKFISVAKSLGKRLIVVAFPNDAEKAKDLFDAVIQLEREGSKYTRHVYFKSDIGVA
ncbi:TPA: ATP-binding protein [Escherichia coli]|nr:ATP-binding protein [Escherichia coli]